MKKTTFPSILLLFALVSQAQVEKGRFMLGGNVNYQQSSYKTDATSSNYGSTSKYTNFNTGIRGGYFLAENFMVGVLINSSSYVQDQKSELDTADSPFQVFHQDGVMNSAGLFGRYYHVLGKSRFAAFGQLDVRYGIGNSTAERKDFNQGIPAFEYRVSTSEIQFSSLLGLGLTYFATKNIAIESYFGNFGYTYNSSISKREGSPDQKNSQSGFNSNINFSLSYLYLGVNFYFGGNSAAQQK